MTMQKRPLSGMVNPLNGEAKPILIGAVPVTVHVEDATTVQQGGPFADEVTVVVNNPTAAPIDFTMVINGVTTVDAIPAKASAAVLVGAVFRSPDGSAAATITGAGQNLVVFGWFMRPL
jgi:hypothetical protein